MAHPYAKFRQGNVERSRVGAITGEPKSIVDAKKATPTLRKAIEGAEAPMRMDRPMRARGGKVGKKATTVVNVITGGQQQPPAPPPHMPMPPPGPMPPPAPPPGAMPPPGAGPMPGAGPGMPPPPMRASGGGVNRGTKVFEESERAGTKVQHSKANTDPKNMNRKRVVTFATGGGVVSFKASGGAVKGVTFKAGADPKSKLPGGAGGGEGRLAKARKY